MLRITSSQIYSLLSTSFGACNAFLTFTIFVVICLGCYFRILPITNFLFLYWVAFPAGASGFWYQALLIGVCSLECNSNSIYLYTLAVSHSLGGSRQHRRNNKTMGISLHSSGNDEGPSRVWMVLLEQYSPSSPVFHNLRRFIYAISPIAPTTGLPL